MAGFGIPDNPYFTEFLNNSVSSLLKTLKDPALPLMEMRVSINLAVESSKEHIANTETVIVEVEFQIL